MTFPPLLKNPMIIYRAQDQIQLQEALDCLLLEQVNIPYALWLKEQNLKKYGDKISLFIEDKEMDHKKLEQLQQSQLDKVEVHYQIDQSKLDQVDLFNLLQSVASKIWINVLWPCQWTAENISLLKSYGVHGIILQPKNGKKLDLNQDIIKDLLCWKDWTEANDLQLGIEFSYEWPDLPRILAFGFDHLILLGSKYQLSDLSLIQNFLQSPKYLKIQTQDMIFVRDFCVTTGVGVYSHEYDKPQKLFFSVEVSLYNQCKEDYNDLSLTMSYDLIVDAIYAALSTGHIELLEEIAERIAQWLLRYPLVEKIKVRIEKSEIIQGFIGVELIRTCP